MGFAVAEVDGEGALAEGVGNLDEGSARQLVGDGEAGEDGKAHAHGNEALDGLGTPEFHRLGEHHAARVQGLLEGDAEHVVGLVDDEGKAHQLLCGLEVGEGCARRGHEGRANLPHLFDGEILGLPVEGVGEPQIAGAIAQVLGHLGAGAVAQAQRHARGALAERGDHLVERIAQKRLGRVHPQRALQRRLLCAEGGQAVGGGDDLGGLGERLGPLLREHHAAPDALEQRQS